jgi:hypothetical protein
MKDILFQTFSSFPIIVLAEVGAIVFLTLWHVKRRLIWIIGSYLLLLSAALAFAMINPDEFGFSFIPAYYITWPWFEVLGKFFNVPSILILVFGAAINCAIFYLIERLIDFFGSGRHMILPPNSEESTTKP